MIIHAVAAALVGLMVPLVNAPVEASSVTVAVLDTGLSAHPRIGWATSASGVGEPTLPIVRGFDFISDPWRATDGDGWDPDPTDRGDGVRPAEATDSCKSRRSTWHGTNVVGTVREIAPTAEIVPIRIMGRCGGNTADVAAAILWAAGLAVPGVERNQHPADIINLSLSGPSESCPLPLQTAINSATEEGAVVVVAAGSSARDARAETPANCQGVVVVSSVDKRGQRSPTSGFGNVVTLAALGGDKSRVITDGIRTTTNTGKYRPKKPALGYYEGSSAAAARVSGALALLGQSSADLRGQQLRDVLTKFVDPFAPGQCDKGDGLCGQGILNLDQVQAHVGSALETE